MASRGYRGKLCSQCAFRAHNHVVQDDCPGRGPDPVLPGRKRSKAPSDQPPELPAGGLLHAQQPELPAGEQPLADQQPQLPAGGILLADQQPELPAGEQPLADQQPELPAGEQPLADQQPELPAGEQPLADQQPKSSSDWLHEFDEYETQIKIAGVHVGQCLGEGTLATEWETELAKICPVSYVGVSSLTKFKFDPHWFVAFVSRCLAFPYGADKPGILLPTITLACVDVRTDTFGNKKGTLGVKKGLVSIAIAPAGSTEVPLDIDLHCLKHREAGRCSTVLEHGLSKRVLRSAFNTAQGKLMSNPATATIELHSDDSEPDLDFRTAVVDGSRKRPVRALTTRPATAPLAKKAKVSLVKPSTKVNPEKLRCSASTCPGYSSTTVTTDCNSGAHPTFLFHRPCFPPRAQTVASKFYCGSGRECSRKLDQAVRLSQTVNRSETVAAGSKIPCSPPEPLAQAVPTGNHTSWTLSAESADVLAERAHAAKELTFFLQARLQDEQRRSDGAQAEAQRRESQQRADARADREISRADEAARMHTSQQFTLAILNNGSSRCSQPAHGVLQPPYPVYGAVPSQPHLYGPVPSSSSFQHQPYGAVSAHQHVHGAMPVNSPFQYQPYGATSAYNENIMYGAVPVNRPFQHVPYYGGALITPQHHMHALAVPGSPSTMIQHPPYVVYGSPGYSGAAAPANCMYHMHDTAPANADAAHASSSNPAFPAQ